MYTGKANGLTCRCVSKKVYINKKIQLYFTYLPRSTPWTDLHKIWHRGSSPGRTQLCQFFW